MRAMIIDFHTHVFPEKIAKKILSDVSRRANIPCYSDGTTQGLLASMANAGIHVSVISRIATRAEQVEDVNQWVMQQAHEGIVPLAAACPDMLPEPLFVRKIKTSGFKGFKLHPDYQNFYVDDRRVYPFYEAVQAEKIPVLFHAGLDRGLPPPVHATPERLRKVHQDFPELIMVAAHMGGEDNYEQTEAYLLGQDIYLDTSFVLREMPLRTLKRFLRRHPIERFLFGSDSPFKDQAAELNFFLDLPFLTQEEKEKIAGHNAAALLGL
jgi:predicted TIM-barrel fold metal-dependent hydrolase